MVNAMKYLLNLTILFLVLAIPFVTKAQNNTMYTKTDKSENQSLTACEMSITSIASLTAKGDLEKLRPVLAAGLEAGLTVNEIKEILVQMYAYAGFPRSLNGINTFHAVLDERKAKGIKDAEGKTATPISGGDKYERGRKTLEKLTGQPQAKPAPGYGEFAPRIDAFLKEHLFADIFDSDVLNYRQRELATIAALAAMDGVGSQLEAHISIGMKVGLTANQLDSAFNVIETNIGRKQADIARQSLAKLSSFKPKDQLPIETSLLTDTVFPKGEKAPTEWFTGTVYLQMLAPTTENNSFSIGSVTFEAGARSHWHPAGQTLLVTNGIGLYQEKGQPIRTIKKGEVVICDKDIEHWHGASSDSQMTHIAITNTKDGQGVTWLKPVTDEEYGGRKK